MSHLRRNKQMPPNAELYCPQYLEFDRKAREDSKIRFKEHVTGRRSLLVQCIDPAVAEIRNTILALEFNQVPRYIDDDKIINDAIGTMNKAIDKWDGVQFSKVFIKEFNKSGKKMDASKFSQISKNHQDQTSWKISGEKFWCPYIARARQFIRDYCQCILNVTSHQRQEIMKLGCIAYAVALLEATIRFHRTKAKPLIRYKTLVKSQRIHMELERLYSELKVKSFIAAAKKRRKAKDGKNTVKSQEFHQQLLDCCKTLYRKQKQSVYDMFNIIPQLNNNGISGNNEFKQDDDEDVASVYPSDLLSVTDADTISTGTNTDNGTNGYVPYSPSVSMRHNNRSGSPREFQHTDPREWSIRNDMTQSLRSRDRRDRSRNRELMIERNRHNRYNYCSSNVDHQQSPSMLPDHANVGFNVDTREERISGPVPGITRAYTDQDPNINIARDGCHLCGQGLIDCRCNDHANMTMMDDATSNSNSHSQSDDDFKRQCEQLQQENDELRRQRDECQRLLRQMHQMQNQHQQQYTQYPSYQPIISQTSYQYQQQQQSQPQYVNFTNDLTYFNALPPQLRLIQPTMIRRGSSLNDDNNGNNNNDISMDLSALNLMNTNMNNNDTMSTSPPFIDNNNDNHNNGNGIIGDVDTPSLPNN